MGCMGEGWAGDSPVALGVAGRVARVARVRP